MAHITRLLLINRHLSFSATLKKTLEQIGGYEVSVFASAEAAFDYLSARAHDVALIDFELNGISGEEIVLRLRDIQPDIAIIASPDAASIHEAARYLRLQGVVPVPLSARALIPVIASAVAAKSPQTQAPTLDSEEVAPDEGFPEDSQAGGADESSKVFELLAAEEPPMPGLEENGTVGDLRDSMNTDVREVVEILRENDTLTTPQPLPPDDSGIDPEAPILARQILNDVMSENADSPSQALTMDDDEARDHEADLGRIATPVTPAQPAASRQEDDDNAAQIALDLTLSSLESAGEAILLTQDGDIVAYAGEMPLEDIEDIRRIIGDDWETNETQSRIRFVTLPGSGKDYMLFSRRTESAFTLSLIFAGNTPLRVIRRQSERILEALESAYGTSETEQPSVEHRETYVEAYIAAPTEEEVEEYSETPAQPAHSMEEVPEHIPEHIEEAPLPAPIAKPAPVPVGKHTPYTYIWMLQDSENGFGHGVTQAIIAGLDRYLSAQGWNVHTLRIHEDYIYLFADVPGERPPHEVIAELKAESGRIIQGKDAARTPQTLWADAYFTLMPGREMSPEEVERFLSFGRAM